jgi:hypothetical protein
MLTLNNVLEHLRCETTAEVELGVKYCVVKVAKCKQKEYFDFHTKY